LLNPFFLPKFRFLFVLIIWWSIIESSIVFGSLISEVNGGLVYAGFIGARYYFTPKFAAKAELGYGIALINIGVSIKL